MTHEEAIENLNHLMSDGTTWTQYDCGEEIAMAIEALKRQIPVKPHRNYKCLSSFWCECGWHIGKQSDGYVFCPQCGHPIDWGKEGLDE